MPNGRVRGPKETAQVSHYSVRLHVVGERNLKVLIFVFNTEWQMLHLLHRISKRNQLVIMGFRFFADCTGSSKGADSNSDDLDELCQWLGKTG